MKIDGSITQTPKHLRSRRWLGAVIVGFWLVAMGLLARRELTVQPLRGGPFPDHERTSDSFMGIFVAAATGEQQVGSVHLHQNPEERRGLRGRKMTFEAEMQLKLLGKNTDLQLSGFTWRPFDREQVEFEFAVRSAEYDFKLAGDLAGGELSAQVFSAGEKFPLKIPVPGDLIFSGGFGATFELPLLEVGETYKLESFDPLTLQKSTARVKCIAHDRLEVEGRTVPARRLEVTMGGVRSLAWVDEHGEVVRAETPVGLILQRLSGGAGRSERLAGEPAADGFADFLGRTAIHPSGRRPFRTARSMTVRLGGLEGSVLPEDGVQAALAPDRYRVTSPAPPPADAPAEPPDPSALAADSFVQSDHPEIRRRAAEVVAGESDPWRRALRIHDWVYIHLDKEPVVSIPSALEVLRRRRGDCNEHTVLFTALARAADLPARIAIGIVWSEELEGFYYHAWPEVHLDGRWIWMDPTLGQPLADATHLKLLNGGIESWPQLLPFLGRLDVEILSIE